MAPPPSSRRSSKFSRRNGPRAEWRGDRFRFLVAQAFQPAPYNSGMSIRVSNLRLPVEEPEAALPAHLARALGVSPSELARWRIVRKALDLRDKRQLRFVYSFEVTL